MKLWMKPITTYIHILKQERWINSEIIVKNIWDERVRWRKNSFHENGFEIN